MINKLFKSWITLVAVVFGSGWLITSAITIHDRQPLQIPNGRINEWLDNSLGASDNFLNSFFQAKSPEYNIQIV